MNDTPSSNITDFLYRRIAPAEGETQNDLRRIGQDILWAFWLLKKKKKKQNTTRTHTNFLIYSYTRNIFYLYYFVFVLKIHLCFSCLFFFSAAIASKIGLIVLYRRFDINFFFIIEKSSYKKATLRFCPFFLRIHTHIRRTFFISSFFFFLIDHL